MMYNKIQLKLGGGVEEGVVQLTPKYKSMIMKALEYYADALGKLKFKYDRDNCENDDKYEGSMELTNSFQPN